MQIVIDIPDSLYENILICWENIHPKVWKILKDGTVLPKGHDALIERAQVTNYDNLYDVPAVIEADNVPNMTQQTMDFFKNLYLQNKEEIDRAVKEYEQNKADVILPQCMQMPLKTYEVWMEGYNCTGQSKQHEFIGTVKAESFEKACEIAVKQWCKSVADFDKYYDAKTQTFWGCKCYNNESDAAKGFG